MVVVYKTAPLTYAVAKRVVKIPHIGMVNIIAGRELCPEFIQGAARPENIIPALQPLLGDSGARAEMIAGLREIFDTLAHKGEKSAGELVAESVEG
jgi:lipid-A-disaccharide synthase